MSSSSLSGNDAMDVNLRLTTSHIVDADRTLSALAQDFKEVLLQRCWGLFSYPSPTSHPKKKKKKEPLFLRFFRFHELAVTKSIVVSFSLTGVRCCPSTFPALLLLESTLTSSTYCHIALRAFCERREAGKAFLRLTYQVTVWFVLITSPGELFLNTTLF